MAAGKFVGTWRLADFRLTDGGGKVTRPWSAGAAGYLIYTADGYMSASVRSPDRDGVIQTLTYCGPYETLEDRNIHHIELSSDPALVGTVQHRLVRFEGEKLVLTASPSLAGGPGTTAEIVWDKA